MAPEGVIWRTTRSAVLPKNEGLNAWALDLPAQFVGSANEEPALWRTYPGLFAKGGVDIMTRFLLCSLPLPAEDGKLASVPSPRRVLDFACGSGTIAAWLVINYPQTEVRNAWSHFVQYAFAEVGFS